MAYIREGWSLNPNHRSKNNYCSDEEMYNIIPIKDDNKMTQELYNYGLEVFNNEEDKYKRFLEKNKHLTEEELKKLLDRIEYSNFC